jgi:hypothetical protein
MGGAEYSRREIMLLDQVGVPLTCDTTVIEATDDTWKYVSIYMVPDVVLVFPIHIKLQRIVRTQLHLLLIDLERRNLGQFGGPRSLSPLTTLLLLPTR